MFYFRKGIAMAYNYPHIEGNADKTYGLTNKDISEVGGRT